MKTLTLIGKVALVLAVGIVELALTTPWLLLLPQPLPITLWVADALKL